MRFYKYAFLILSCLTVTLTSFADADPVTGKSCKDFIIESLNSGITDKTSPMLVMSKTQEEALRQFEGSKYDSPRDVLLGEFDLHENMNSTAKAYVHGIKKIVANCQAQCGGLSSVKGYQMSCDQFSLVNIKQVHHLVRDEAWLLDSAVGYANATTPTTDNQNAVPTLTDAQAGEDKLQQGPAAKPTTPAYKNHWVRPVDQGNSENFINL